MTTLAPGEVVDESNPRLTTHIAVRGYLTEPVSLEYQIFDRTNSTPTQVFPLVDGDRATVNLVDDLVSVGQYIARWTVPNDATDGRYEVRWFATIEAGANESRWSRFFDVRASAFVNPGRAAYALVSDVRAEGTFTNVTDERLQDALLAAAEQIDTWTGRSFVPLAKTISISGTNQRVLVLGEPICAIDTVTFDGSSTEISRDGYRVFARHLTENLRSPDDRESPMLEFTNRIAESAFIESTGYPYAFSGRRFATGAQNVLIAGVFGYTEFDGSPCGQTPRAVRRASVLLALREIFPQTSSQGWWAQNEAFISEKRTREQSITIGGGSGGGSRGGGMGGPTGDPEIDRLIMSVMPTLHGTGC